MTPISLHMPGRFIEERYQLDVFSYESPQHPLQLGNGAVEIHRSDIQHLFPTEGKQLMRQSSCPFGCSPDLREPLRLHTARRSCLDKQVRVTAHPGKEVVKIMRYSSREPAYRLHLGSLPDLLLEHLTLRYVPYYCEDQFLFG